MMHFLNTSRHFFLRTAVNHCYPRAQTQGGTCGVHGNIAASYHRHMFTHVNGSVRIGRISRHQVTAGQKLVGRYHSVQIFTRNPHKFGKSGSGAYKYGIEAFPVHKLIYCDRSSHHYVSFYSYAEFLNLVNFVGYHFVLGQPEFGNSVYQHTSGFVKRFKNGYPATGFGQIGGTGQSGRTRSDNRHFFPVERSHCNR